LPPDSAAQTVTDDALSILITQAAASGSALRAEKGINFPDTDIAVSPLTAKDRQDLAFVVEHADMIGYSFVSKAEDVDCLHTAIEDPGPKRPSIVLKIETRRAFAELPPMLLAAMRWPEVGIMMARGDLAVEVGFQRLAEVQEEILWLAGAGHVPVIWATQVLETLARTGVPSRSEITDAAMGERAECVMLNKGPYIVQAIAALDDIQRRMSDHQRKNRSLLRQLKAWQSGLSPAE
jgi:pyruvate kinase